jgi:membrane protein DedA with SNARE-associated domain/rhodanese-related sulfurtransferase
MDALTDILHHHGSLLVFGVVFAEQLGLPLPALPLLVAAGVLIGTGHVGLLPALLAAFLATLLADGLWYVAGRRRGRSVLALLCKIALEPDTCVRRTEDFFRTHGPHALVLAKFVPGLSTIAPPLAGVAGLGPLVFLFYDAIGTALWVGSGLGLGYAVGAGAPQSAVVAAQMTPVVGLAVAGLMLLYLVGKAWQRRRELRRAPRITPAEVAERLQAGADMMFIDLRAAADQREAPGIAGALTVSLEDLPKRAGILPKDRTLVLYCACPDDASSAQATVILRRLGFDRAHALRGGLAAWQARERAARRWPAPNVELPVLPNVNS